MPRNLDAELEALQPPASLLDALKPPPDTPVQTLLDMPRSKLSSNLKVRLSCEAWFSTKDIAADHIPCQLDDITTPPLQLCQKLEDRLAFALETGLTAVEHPALEGIYLPLWCVRAWKWASRLGLSQRFWQDRLYWAEDKATHEGWSECLQTDLRAAIMSSPWQGGVSELQQGCVPVNHLARVLLSDEWLTGDAFDCILDRIRTRRNPGDSVQIAEAWLCQAIETGSAAKRLSHWGNLLRDGHVKTLLLPWNIPNLHWLIFEIDSEHSLIRIGDSKPRLSQTYLDKILGAIRAWIQAYLPLTEFSVGEPLDVEEQSDSFSCGIACATVILKRALPLACYPKWDPRKPFEMRAFLFVLCVGNCSAKPPERDGPEEILATRSIPDYLEPADVEDRVWRNHEYHEALCSPESPLVEDPISSAEYPDSDGYVTPPRPRSPSGKKTSRTSSKAGKHSKKLARVASTTYRQDTTKDDSDNGSTITKRHPWTKNPKFPDFKQKVLALDASAEFDVRCEGTVICGRCRKPVPMRSDRPYSAAYFKSHLKSDGCQKATGAQRGMQQYLRPAPGITETKISQPCPGLTDAEQPRIETYLNRSATEYGGHPHRSKLKEQLLAEVPGLSRDPKRLMRRVRARERAEAIWFNDHLAMAVFSATCQRNVVVEESPHLKPCNKCQDLLRNRVFRNAIRRKMPDVKNAKFTPHGYRNPVLGEAFARHIDVQELVLLPKSKRWLTLASRGAQGRYDSYEAFLGICNATMEIENRRAQGKGLQNMKYDTAWDTICTNAALMSPRVYRMLQGELGGRSFRNIQLISTKAGRFQVGFAEVNFDSARDWTARVGYDGPLVLAVDDSKLLPGLGAYKNGTSWQVAGFHGLPIGVDNYEDVVNLSDTDRSLLAEKVRVWLLIIPLPGIPPKLLATLPICSKVSKTEVATWHSEVERGLASRGLHYLSYNVDGASVERGFGHILEKSAQRTRKWYFDHPIPNRPRLLLEAPLLANGKPRVISTDGKHSKKNARGSATSGARVLALGNHLAHIGHLSELAESPGSPLLKSDIIGVDKQDDRAAARLFSAAVIQQLKETQPTSLGLIIYLFVIGAVVDAQQSRSMTHLERVRILWRGHFFLEGWREFIVSHPHYSVNTHFITRELYDILSIFINAMLLLILIHRDFFPRFPLCLWLHSTEACEHFYGCARQIQPEWTAKQWILMIPKITLLMNGQMSRWKGIQGNTKLKRHGYFHSWFDGRGVDLERLVRFPTDREFQMALDTAYFEASSLLDILGMQIIGKTTLPDDPLSIPAFRNALLRLQGDGFTSCTDVYNDDPTVAVQATSISANTILLLDGQEAVGEISFPCRYERKMANIACTAIANEIHKDITIENLPEHGEREEDEWRSSVRAMAEEVEKALSARRQVQAECIKDSETEHASSTQCKMNSQRRDRVARAKEAAIDFGSDVQFNFAALIAERQQHETSEAKSAITHRFRNAKDAPSKIKVAQDHSGDSEIHKEQEPDGQSSQRMDIQVVNQLTRFVSESLTGTEKKNSTAGVERLARWKMIGLSGKAETVDLAIPSDEIQAGNARRQKYLDARQYFRDLDRSLAPFSLVTGNINPFHVLRPKSWVLVYFEKRVFVGEVKVIYVEGGGKTPSHNYTPSCSDIFAISRLVVQLYQPFSIYYSPLVEFDCQKPSFAFLHQANLLGSLDMVGKVMEDTEKITFSPGIDMLKPTPAFKLLMDTMASQLQSIIAVAEKVVEACKPRSSMKHGINDIQIDGDIDGIPPQKRSKID